MTYDDEISLIDLWNVIYKWRKLAIGVILAVFLASLAYTLTATRIYESRAVVAIGFFEVETTNSAPAKRYIEEPGLFTARAREKYRITAEPSKNKNEANIITLKTTSTDPLQSQKKLEASIANLIQDHENAIADYMSLQSFNLDLKKKQVAEISSLIEDYDPRIRAVERQNPALAAILTLDKRSLMEKDMNLRASIEATEMNPAQPVPTEILKQPDLPGSPIKPKTNLVLALSIVLGVFMGLFSAFMAEFAEKAKASMNDRKPVNSEQ